MVKFVSLLGTGSYIPCNYYLGSPELKVDDRCYVQQAILEILEKKQNLLPDEIIIFTTPEANEKNWEKNAYTADKNRLGLRDELDEFAKRTKAKVKKKDIPSGQNEKELWEIFDSIFSTLEFEDEIILDITHAFRYLPMLAFIVLNYARAVKRCKIRAIYYGAFETLGSYADVNVMPMEKRNAPIFDLTPFVVLFDWVIGVDRYLATGDAANLDELTTAEIKKINEVIGEDISQTQGAPDYKTLYKDPNLLKVLAKSMTEFSNVVLTCRGQRITEEVKELKESLNKVIENNAHEKIKPLSPLMDILKERFDKFSSDNDVVNVLETAEWCHNNGMYQQGLTILHEGLISYVCDKYGIKDKLKTRERENINTYSYMISENYIIADNLAINMEQENANELFILISEIGKIRNDINHAGWNDSPAAPQKFRKLLAESVEKAKELLQHEIKTAGSM
jgi:CRISPR-associated Csx2 family protein